MSRRYNFYKTVLHNHFGNKCEYCGQGDDLHLHHKKHRALGGTDEIHNLELVCNKCHYDLHRQFNKIFPKKIRSKGGIEEYIKIFGFKKKMKCEISSQNITEGDR